MVNMIKTPMADLNKQAKLSLAKHGLVADGTGGVKVRLALDHSGSMGQWYEYGAVQRLTEQVLGLASALDDDGTIEVWYFGTGVSEMQLLSLKSSGASPAPDSPRRGLFGRQGRRESAVDPYYVGWVDRTHPLQPWGRTNYVAPLQAVSRFRKEEKETEPTLLIFQTDGGPDSRPDATEALRAISGEDIFVAFVGFGRPGSYGMDYLDGLNTIGGRVRDNASSFICGGLDEFASLPDEAVYDGVLEEFVGQWLPQVL